LGAAGVARLALSTLRRDAGAFRVAAATPERGAQFATAAFAAAGRGRIRLGGVACGRQDGVVLLFFVHQKRLQCPDSLSGRARLNPGDCPHRGRPTEAISPACAAGRAFLSASAWRAPRRACPEFRAAPEEGPGARAERRAAA